MKPERIAKIGPNLYYVPLVPPMMVLLSLGHMASCLLYVLPFANFQVMDHGNYTLDYPNQTMQDDRHHDGPRQRDGFITLSEKSGTWR